MIATDCIYDRYECLFTVKCFEDHCGKKLFDLLCALYRNLLHLIGLHATVF